MKFSFIISFLLISSFETVNAQNAYVKLGQQAFMDGDFKDAIHQLEKACSVDSTNSDALWMLGYSYYHSNDYKKSITAYTKVISIKPTDASAYYYRARAKSYLGKDVQLSMPDKEKYLLGAIFDLTKAIEINTDPADIKFYQNRALAYRDYSSFKLTPGSHFYDRNRGVNSLKAAINDFQKVLDKDPSRSDITSLIESSKEKLSIITGHRS